jgi:hypothetical protein
VPTAAIMIEIGRAVLDDALEIVAERVVGVQLAAHVDDLVEHNVKLVVGLLLHMIEMRDAPIGGGELAPEVRVVVHLARHLDQAVAEKGDDQQHAPRIRERHEHIEKRAVTKHALHLHGDEHGAANGARDDVEQHVVAQGGAKAPPFVKLTRDDIRLANRIHTQHETKLTQYTAIHRISSTTTGT